MNTSLFRSRHGLIAAAIVGGFWAWLASAGITPGRSSRIDVPYLLTSGWIVLLLFLVVVLYSARKYAHKRRLTPEFRWKVPVARIESALVQVNQVRVRALAGELRSRRAITRTCREILRREGVSRILRVRVRRGPAGRPGFDLDPRWREPIGRVAYWMQAHLYYGLAAGFLVWFHGAGNFRTPMGLILNGLSLLVIGTGCVGIVLWTFGPSWLTRREGDLSIEKAFNLREHYRRKSGEAESELAAALQADPGAAASLLDRLGGRGASAGASAASAAILASLPPQMEAVRPVVRDLLVLRAQEENVKREWKALARIRFYLNIWRAVHVPASILLLVAVAVHIISVWWY